MQCLSALRIHEPHLSLVVNAIFEVLHASSIEMFLVRLGTIGSSYALEKVVKVGTV